ncbi:hypothetical protein SAY87_014490 [Trapa incisa]|uniref:ABCC10-like N-terminal domain-containing protein n=1 Tax=Trapa incisa TaxID=236973 RepID=A0AAN7GSQ1_9MYRT|nr:hypothetical protein SAY87_014490 [Trapa incisa]
MEALSSLFCNATYGSIINPHSCSNHVVVISMDTLFVLAFLTYLIYKSYGPRNPMAHSGSTPVSLLRIVTISSNGLLSMCYIGIGIWIIHTQVKSIWDCLPHTRLVSGLLPRARLVIAKLCHCH